MEEDVQMTILFKNIEILSIHIQPKEVKQIEINNLRIMFFFFMNKNLKILFYEIENLDFTK